MRRRDLIAMIGGASAAWSLSAQAQQSAKIYRIGVLETVPAVQGVANFDALRQGLRELGYIDGRNLVIEYRSADGRAERFPDLASELVRLNVDLIMTRGTPAALAAKKVTETIPVVMLAIGAPLEVVDSVAHPGGNMTGLTTFSTVLTGKRVELLKELNPSFSRVALLHDMGNPVGPPQWEETQTAARSLGLAAELLDARTEEDLRRAFGVAIEHHVDALLVGINGLTQMYQRAIVDLAARGRLPTVYSAREFVEAGGLMAYGIFYPDLYFRAASFIDKIFRGAKPADLPVEQPTKFELIINLRTAKALGMDVPRDLLLRADEVIE